MKQHGIHGPSNAYCLASVRCSTRIKDGNDRIFEELVSPLKKQAGLNKQTTSLDMQILDISVKVRVKLIKLWWLQKYHVWRGRTKQ